MKPRTLRLILALGIFVSSCAKVGVPHPPVLRIPQRTQELSGMQVGDEIILTCPLPTANTNGTPVSTLKRVDVYRLDDPRTMNSRPLSEQEYKKNARIIRSVDKDALKEHARNDQFVFRDTLNIKEPATFAKGLHYAVKFVNEKNQDAGFSNYVHFFPAVLPDPPKALQIRYDQHAIEVQWEEAQNEPGKGTPATQILGYNLYRREEGQSEERRLNETPITETQFKDAVFEFGKNYAYTVSVITNANGQKAESFRSSAKSVTPIDTFAPGPPAQLTAFVEEGRVSLVWTPNQEPDLAGYNVYRAEGSGKTYVKLNSTLLTQAAYKDTNVEIGKKYSYVVKAVDKSGNESRNSNEVVESP